jgi:hypothetical protein
LLRSTVARLSTSTPLSIEALARKSTWARFNPFVDRDLMPASRFNANDWYRPLSLDDSPAQGDQLYGVALRQVIPDPDNPESYVVGRYKANVIVATQSCDLEDRNVAAVEVIPIYSLTTWLKDQPTGLNDLEAIRRGHIQSLYLLPAWPDGDIPDSRVTRVVSLDEKRSMGWHEFDAALRGQRHGLRSPYIEHFSQAVARFYMRVGLPENLPRIEWTIVEGPISQELPLGAMVGVGLPVPPRPVRYVLSRFQLANVGDRLWKAALERDSNFLGVGSSAEEAIDSMMKLVATKYQTLVGQPVEEGKRRHWLLRSFTSIATEPAS